MLDRQAHQFAAGGQRGAGPRSGLHFYSSSAVMAKLADAPDLDSGGRSFHYGHGGSIPLHRTTLIKAYLCLS
jgi:hypothetical protein